MYSRIATGPVCRVGRIVPDPSPPCIIARHILTTVTKRCLRGDFRGKHSRPGKKGTDDCKQTRGHGVKRSETTARSGGAMLGLRRHRVRRHPNLARGGSRPHSREKTVEKLILRERTDVYEYYERVPLRRAEGMAKYGNGSATAHNQHCPRGRQATPPQGTRASPPRCTE